MLNYKETEHSYGCETQNWLEPVSKPQSEYNSWSEFKEEWMFSDELDLDFDLNLLFRFDLKKHYDEDDMCLYLFFILQRKGHYKSVQIRNIQESDMPEITTFLQKAYKHLTEELWTEFKKLEEFESI